MNRKQLTDILENKHNYSGKNLELVLNKIEKMGKELRDGLEIFLIKNEIMEIYREGYSIETLMEKHGMNPVAAYLTLDYLEKDPERAKNSLMKGHDTLS